MTEEKARRLVQLYIDGWKENNLEKILLSLSEKCTIIESHGPTYNGKQDVKEWVEHWINENWKIQRWNITSFLFVHNIAVFEWEFTFFLSQENPRNIDGVSIVKVSDDKIDYLREYRTTKPLYVWKQERKLNTY